MNSTRAFLDNKGPAAANKDRSYETGLELLFDCGGTSLEISIANGTV